MQEILDTIQKQPSPEVMGMLFVLALIFLTSFRPRHRGGAAGGPWQDRMEEMRERVRQREEEQKAFQNEVLTELRKLSTASERQAELLAQILAAPAPPAPPEPAADENTPAPEPVRKRKPASGQVE